MMEEVFKENDGTVILDRNFDNFLPLRNLGASNNSVNSGAAATGGR
jgi:membrane protease subunit HflK